MGYQHCFERLKQAAGRELSDDELSNLFGRIHKAALDIKAGRVKPQATVQGELLPGGTDGIVQQAAREAAAQMIREAELKQRQAQLQVTRISARMRDLGTIESQGVSPLDAVEKTIVRDYSGKINVESIEQRVAGHQAYFKSKLMGTWDALGNDWLGFFQDKEKLPTLVRELRGEKTGDALAAKGAKAFHDAAEEARQVFNQAGGDVGKLDDWGMPQHHSQEKVAMAGREDWVNNVLPKLDRSRYVDDMGTPWDDASTREFLGKAWDTIATNGHANTEPGVFKGSGGVANRHSESRQIHFKDAQTVIDYWNTFGDKTAAEVLLGHIETMARDIAFVEQYGPNPVTTYRTLRDSALQKAVLAEPTKTADLEGRAVKLDTLFDYSSGRTKPSASVKISRFMDAVANLNAAGKLGGAALASFFGDKVMVEAVSHLNNLPLLQRWRTETSLLNPLNTADRRLIQQQGLMLEGVRSGLNRFYEGLGTTGTTGKLSNAVMRITGMSAINEIRKGAFGASLMSAIGEEIAAGKSFADLESTDIRTLKNFGITADDWAVWQKAKPVDLGSGNKNALTPEGISRIEGLDADTKRNAIVKLLGAVNTESDFAVVTPGWKERSQFYGNLHRGTFSGEVTRSILQFKSFPWAQFQRMMDAVANKDTPVSKAAMTAALLTGTTLAGAMLLQTRDMLTGKDPRDMTNPKFAGAAFLAGGALGIYGDFIYSIDQTRFGTGPLEVMAGPTIGPALSTITNSLGSLKKSIEGKDTHFAAKELQDLKGFVPGGNIWYTKAALDHLVWQQVFEALSPGYLSSIRQKTQKDYGQDWWYAPGQATPDRAPDLSKAFGG